MKKVCRNSLVVFVSLASLVYVAGSLSSTAAPLPPGIQLLPPPFEPEPVGGLLVGQVVAPYSNLDIQGTLVSSVYSGDASNPWVGIGGLTFTYEVIASVGSPEAVKTFTVGNYGGFLTDVSYDNVQLPGVVPTGANRSLAPGNVMSFSFFPGILSGQNSALLVVQTDAQNHVGSLASVIDATAVTVQSLAPKPVPEPATFALLGLGTLALILTRKQG